MIPIEYLLGYSLIILGLWLIFMLVVAIYLFIEDIKKQK